MDRASIIFGLRDIYNNAIIILPFHGSDWIFICHTGRLQGGILVT